MRWFKVFGVEQDRSNTDDLIAALEAHERTRSEILKEAQKLKVLITRVEDLTRSDRLSVNRDSTRRTRTND